MIEKNTILSSLPLRTKPNVPDGFFEQFSADLMLKIEEETGFLGQLTKSKKPDLPDGYFDQLVNPIFSTESSFNLDELSKRNLPPIPAGYFDRFNSDLLEKIKKEQKNDSGRKGRIIPLRIIAAIGAVAASIAVIFSVVNSMYSNKQIDAGLVETQTEETLYDTYLTYLDEDEIIDYIIENDIEISDADDPLNDDDYLDYSAEDVEEFYLELL